LWLGSLVQLTYSCPFGQFPSFSFLTTVNFHLDGEAAMCPNFRACSVTLVLALFLCFLGGPLAAGTQSLPDAITHAHTVFVENQTGFNELQYALVLELSKWGRFDLTDAREKADVILRLENGNRVRVLPDGEFPRSPTASPAAESAVPKGYTRIALLDPKSSAVLWSDLHKTEGGKVKSGHLLDGLREAFDAYEKSRR
jgi:hypothetical protein